MKVLKKLKKGKIKSKSYLEMEEYYFLTDKLEEVEYALKGECNDIDCDKYVYRALLKKKCKPVLKHSFSCIRSLKMEKDALMRILSLSRYNKFRFKKCEVCKRKLDLLGVDCTIVGFTRPDKQARASKGHTISPNSSRPKANDILLKTKKEKYFEFNSVYTHKKCRRKFVIPKGWERM